MHQIIREIHHIGNDTREQIVAGGDIAALSARQLEYVGFSDAGRAYRMARPRPSLAHLLLSCAGAGQVWIDGRFVDCLPNHAYLSPPHAPLAFHTIPRQRWQFAWAFIRPPCAGLLAGDRALLIPADPHQFVAAIQGLYHESVGRADSILLDQWAALVHAHALRIIEPQSTGHDPLAPLWAHVDARLAEPWTLGRLAAHANLTPESLRRLSQRHLHTSPMRHLTTLRMRRAEMLLRSTTSKLATLSRQVGYQNSFAFSTAFKRHSGAPPKSHRASVG